MGRLRRLTHCSVPGHGDRCVVAKEKGRFFSRGTEEAEALRYEMDADPPLCGDPTCEGPGCRQSAIDAWYERCESDARDIVWRTMSWL